VSFVAVWQDASHATWGTVLAIAFAIGSLKMGAIEVSTRQEGELSMFIQQAILPIFHHIVTLAANLLMQQGYPPEAVFTDLYLPGTFQDHMEQAARIGLLHALRQSSMTEQYATLSRLERFNESKMERLMEITLEEIRDGKFAQEWAREYADGHPRLNNLLKQQQSLDLWELEQQTLEFFESGEEDDRN
jgi:ketol-acid reductoisomerase